MLEPQSPEIGQKVRRRAGGKGVADEAAELYLTNQILLPTWFSLTRVGL